MLPSEYIKVSCSLCAYNCTGIPPYFNRHCSVQFYYIPNRILDRILNIKSYDDDISTRRDLFQDSYLRVDCFSCLSTISCAWTDLNITNGRIRLFKEGFARIQSTRFRNMQNFRVIDYNKLAISIVPPRNLINFDRQTRTEMDENYMIYDRIHPFKHFTLKFLRDLVMTKQLPRDCFLPVRATCRDKHMPFDSSHSSIFYKDPNIPFDSPQKCITDGHELYPSTLDIKRSCIHCRKVLGHNRHAQTLRIRSYSDPFLYSSIMIN